MSKLISSLSTLIFLCLLACGGGSSDPEPAENQAPSANVAADFSSVEGALVLLQSSASDSDGTIVSYAWSQSDGTPTVTLANADAATASFTAPAVESDTLLTFTLTVTDNDGATGTDTVVVTITPDQPPVAVAPADFEAVENTAVTLDGSASSDDVSIASYSWVQISGDAVVLNNQNSVVASFIAPDMAEAQTLDLSFRLTVTDSLGATATDDVTVTVIDTPPLVALSGTITFDLVPHTSADALDHDNTSQAPVRGATIELLNAAGSSVLQTGRSDETGAYSFEVNAFASYIVRVKAEYTQTATASWDFSVVDNTNDDGLYVMDSTVQAVEGVPVTLDLNADSGWTGTGYGNPRVAGPFAILDGVYQAVQKVFEVDANIQFPALKLHWSVNNINTSGQSNDQCVNFDAGTIGTSFYTTNSGCPGIYILGDANSDTDEFDDHVIIHEWGHYFEDKLSRSDSIGGQHSGSDKLDMRVALGEGYGNALSGIVTDDPLYQDSFGNNQSSGFSINVESNPTTNKGWFSESSVQSLLYDFYDSAVDGSDNIALGFGPIYETLIAGQKNTSGLTSIFSFANQLKLEVPADSASIDSLLTSQSIIAADDYGSGETNNGGDARNLAIYKSIVIDGAAVEVCSFDTNGTYNKLGNRQFIRFEITVAGNYTFTANGQGGGDDPDFYVYQQGSQVFNSEADGDESTTQTLSTGDYVMDVYEFANVGSNQTPKDTCIDVSISSN